MSQKVSKARHAGTGRILPVLAFALLLAPAAGAAESRGALRAVGQAEPPANIVAEPPRTPADRTIDRIVQDLKKKYRAEVAKQEVREERGRKVLVLRLVSDEGNVRNVRVDVETGKEL